MDRNELVRLGKTINRKTTDPVTMFLNLVVSIPQSRYFLQPYMKKFTVKEIVEIINYLVAGFDSALETPKEPKAKWVKKKSKFLRTPKTEQLLEWASALVDTHMSALVLIDECNEAVKKLSECVNNHVNLCRSISPLLGIIDHMLNSGNLPTPISHLKGSGYQLLVVDFEAPKKTKHIGTFPTSSASLASKVHFKTTPEYKEWKRKKAERKAKVKGEDKGEDQAEGQGEGKSQDEVKEKTEKKKKKYTSRKSKEVKEKKEDQEGDMVMEDAVGSAESEEGKSK